MSTAARSRGDMESRQSIADLSQLEHLQEDTLLAALRERYAQGKYYTYVGDVTIAINPNKTLKLYDEKHHRTYTNVGLRSSHPPHIFWVADKAYQRMRTTRADQTILISGESGAGKTESAKYIIQHIAHLCPNHVDNLHTKVVKVNPLLEAFGNAQTIINDNSSRFGKYVEVHFTRDGTLTGAEIQEYLLEKSRVVQRGKGDRNFHIFYYLLAGLSAADKQLYGLGNAEDYRIMRNASGEAVFPDVDDRAACQQSFRQIEDIMSADIGLDGQEVELTRRLVASILHLTNITFEESETSAGGVTLRNTQAFDQASTLLQVSREEFYQALTTDVVKRGVHDDEILISKSLLQAEDGRDALAKSLYQRLFSWLVRKVNQHLHDQKPSSNSGTVGILDMSGFENVSNNGLEQLLINVANERLQFFFNEHLFSQEQEQLTQGGIDWTKINYDNNGPILDMLMGSRGRRDVRSSLLDVIDEESRTPQSTDGSLVRHLHRTFGDSQFYQRTHRGDAPRFGINHFAGQVTYNAVSFLERNRDTLSPTLVRCLQRSSQRNIAELFGNETNSTGTLSRSDGTRQTVAQSFQGSLHQLMERLSKSQPLFVRCVKANQSRAPFQFDTSLVTQQMLYNGLLELAKIRKIGFPIRLALEEFVRRYSPVLWSYPDVEPSATCCRNILARVEIDDAMIGDEKVFLKEWHRDELDAQLGKLHGSASVVQKWYRGYRARQKFRTLVRTAQAKARAKLQSKTPAGPGSVAAPDYETLPNAKGGGKGGRGAGRGRVSSGGADSRSEMGSSRSDSAVFITGDDEDEDVLPSHLWDIFRMIPRERISASESFAGIMRLLKFFTYVVFFLLLAASLVLSKGSLLLITTTLRAVEDNTSLRNTMVTSLVICMSAPHGLASILYLFKALFGSQPWPKLMELVTILVVESLQTLAMCVLVFMVVPKLDLLRGVFVLSATSLIPGIFKVAFGRPPHPERQPLSTDDLLGRRPEGVNKSLAAACNLGDKTRTRLWYVANVLAVLVQASAMGVLGLGGFEASPWGSSSPSTNQTTSDTSTNAYLFYRQTPGEEGSTFSRWALPLALTFISLTWWENFIDTDVRLFRGAVVVPLRKWKIRMHNLRQKTTLFTSIWNTGIIIAFPYAVFTSFQLELQVKSYKRKSTSKLMMEYAPIIAQILSSFLAYVVGYLVCRLSMQKASFNIPLLLCTPLTLLVVSLQCYMKFIPPFGVFVWHCYERVETGADSTTIWQWSCCALWWVSQMVICGHIWWPRQHPMDRMEKLFVRPLYTPAAMEQSLLLNRRRNDHEVKQSDFNGESYIVDEDENKSAKSGNSNATYATYATIDGASEVPMIYACATMWHETQNEMTQLMKSVFRMDKDQSIRRNLIYADASYKDPDYYEYETHIMFDDAMKFSEEDESIPNDFVKQLVSIVNDAASSVHNVAVTLDHPTRTPTPYGGRLTWVLPGGTKLLAHLKDKSKIRHKKRWSQCMYMYYLLGYRMAGIREEQFWKQTINKGKKTSEFLPGSIFKYLPESFARKAQNTFLLCLDGDVDFKPDAVRLLLDQMKTNPKAASVCGRIHPIGAGPVVWFQMFEYAIGHWLQKASENVFGCVLCSPGCFSLFRGASLMDDNVMRRYCSLAQSPVEVVQFDQGEDRWLCTLLLQQGYSVAYCAAADALTYAPESFHDFYNQRRRWMPSTMANIVDLLSSYDHTVRKNDNISYLYMIFQFVMFCASILAPGTTLMMVAGSFNAVLGTDLWQSNLLALGPIIFYVLVCFTTKPDTQILVAMGMSAVYSLVMTIVIVGTVINAFEESLTSPNVVFLLTLTIFFILAAFLHPQEILCLIPGLLYWLVFPSAYLLLPIYSLCNLNVVSWGTREVPKQLSREEQEKIKKMEEEMKEKERNKRKGLLNWLGINAFMQDLKEFYNSMLGRRAGPESTTTTDTIMLGLKESVDRLTATVSGNPPLVPPAGEGGAARPRNQLREMLQQKSTQEQARTSAESDQSTGAKTTPPPAVKEMSPKKKKPKPVRDDMVNPAWIDDKAIGEGKLEPMDPKETAFWKQLLKIYLHPLEKIVEKEKQSEDDLRSLRTNIVFGFLMVNLLWIAAIFQLQLLKESLGETFFVPIPRADDPDGEPMYFEPLSFAFLSVFGIVLFLQFVGTLVHRWDTFLQILSRTEMIHRGNTVEGKFRLAEKLQSIDTIPEDEPFKIPTSQDLTFTHDHPQSSDYLNDGNDSGLQIDFNGRTSLNSQEPYQGNGDVKQSDQRQLPSLPSTLANRSANGRPVVGSTGMYGVPTDVRGYHNRPPPGGYADARHRGARQQGYDPRLQERRLGRVHIGADTLSRNFQRRFHHLQNYRGDGQDQVGRGYRPAGGQTAVQMNVDRQTSRETSFNDIYKTVRRMMDSRPRPRVYQQNPRYNYNRGYN